MRQWEYHVEVIPVERWDGNPSTWSILDTPHGETKIAANLNEFGSWGWNLVALFPVVSEDGAAAIPPALYATFKRLKE